MREINLGAEKVSAQGGPGALTLYQREFKDNGKRYDWYADQEEAYAKAENMRASFAVEAAESSETQGEFDSIKYISALEPLFLLRTLWACAKNANENSVPSFEEWHKSLDISMAPWADWKWEVWLLIQAEIFRATKDQTQTPPEQEESVE